MEDEVHEGGYTMLDRKMEEKGHTDVGGGLFTGHKDTEFVCPVCKRPLHEDNLVDMKSVVEDNMYYVGGVRIVNSRIVLHCDCEHQCDEEGLKLDNPHKLVAVVNAEFDDEGKCGHFEIKEVLKG